MRRSEVDEHGEEQHVHEEFAVLDRVGRLQLPSDFTAALDMRERVRLALEPDHIGVWPDAVKTPVDGTTGPGNGRRPRHARREEENGHD